MNNLNYIYIIPLLIVMLISTILFFRGKKSSDNKNSRLVLPISIILILLSTLVINHYYEKQFQLEKMKLEELLKTSRLNDRLLNSPELRDITIDSLKNNNAQLQDILDKIKKQEKVIGIQDKLTNEIKTKIKNNKNDIGEIEKYNEILDKEILLSKKGYSPQETSNFIFNCPTDFENDYLELKLVFQDEKLISKIDYIYIAFTEKTGENRYVSIYEQIYSPQNGVNGFKVKNYFKIYKGKKIDLDVGYFLKSQQRKDYPRFERVVCKNY